MFFFLPSLYRVSIVFVCIVLVGFVACAPHNTEQTTDILEADQHILALRVQSLEQRLTSVEESVGTSSVTYKTPLQPLPAPVRVELQVVSDPSQAFVGNETPPLALAQKPVSSSVVYEPTPVPPLAPLATQTNDYAPTPPLAMVNTTSGAPQHIVDQDKPAPVVRHKKNTTVPANFAARPVGTTGSAAYDTALEHYYAKSYTQAIKDFAYFVDKYPQSKLSPNAYYWTGECYYAQSDYTSAIVSFSTVVSKYPKDEKAAAALLKIGMSYQQLQDKQNASFYWDILIKDYPKSSPAKVARTKLAAL